MGCTTIATMDDTGKSSSSRSSRKRSPADADLGGGDSACKQSPYDVDPEDDEAFPNAVAERMERMSNSDGMLCNTCRAEEEALDANTTRMVDLKTKLKEMKRRLRELKRLARSDLVERRKIFVETICGNPVNVSVDLHTNMDAIGAVLTCARSINNKKYDQNLKNWWTERAQYADTKKELKDLRSQRPLLTRQLL